MPDTVSKYDWLTAEQCLSGGWFGLREVATPPDEAERFRMEQGQEVGALARKLFPDGVLVDGANGESADEVTQSLISDPRTSALFEPSFRVPPFVAKADILRRVDGAWQLLEVKSSFSDTAKLSELVDDLAYTLWVLRKAGVDVTRAALVLLSRQYRYSDGPERLFEIVDKTDEANSRASDYEAAAAATVSALFRDEPPSPTLSSACRECSRFGDTCLRTRSGHSVLEIPQLHHTKLRRLSEAGIVDLEDVPADLKLNDRQERAKAATLSGNTIIEPGLATALASLEWPCHYLDFETVATVLPLYDGHGCHRQVLTQFSIHHRDNMDAEPRHSEYLADATMDCERELAEELIQQLGDRGSILVYSSFEQTRIKGLRDSFPDLAGRLDAILARLKDLLAVVKDNVYHPEFHGSFSIKTVLPALVPSLSYEGLDVRNGDMAIARFARMARGEITGNDVEVTRRQLLEYCAMDTLAMVSLHEVLHQFATARRRTAGR